MQLGLWSLAVSSACVDFSVCVCECVCVYVCMYVCVYLYIYMYVYLGPRHRALDPRLEALGPRS